MPAKSEKQRKFFGAVMGAKKGKGKVKGAAKKVAKEMPEKEIKKFLKKESYDDLVSAYLKMYLIESDVRMDPREGFADDPFIDPTEDMSEGPVSLEDMYNVVVQHVGVQKASMMGGDEIKELYYYIQKDPSMGEEDCEEGCQCEKCRGGNMLKFYGFAP